MEKLRYPEHIVFGLDIGTRSIVGTVGYKDGMDGFKVIAQYVKEHETRAMIDGQIHDILAVSNTIATIKKELENQIGRKLSDVCIAAAGRVLKSVSVKAEYEFPNETIVSDEHIHSLDLIGVEKGYDIIRKESNLEDIQFYCVGYTVVKYYLNDYTISNLEGHKANKIGTELLATFLPEEVINSLYTAVERAGLQVTNLTLEPIAAINVAIPEKFRLLNIALVDVGAGTSDICITKDGSIIAYGMIPFAGDEITETIAREHLVEFKTAEKIKCACLKKKTVSYKDIMGLSHKVITADVIKEISETVNHITKNIAEKIIELNGGKSVSAVFVVGGGGKIPGFVTSLSEYLGLSTERVALRGAEVLKEVEFLQPGIKKDSLLVTPIGICLNYYEQKNNFIFIHVNGERIKLYDNSKLTIIDAATQVGFPNEKLFGRRGKSIEYTLNGEKRMVRGELGEAAIVKLNGKVVGINAPIVQNDRVEIIESTIGKDATYEVRQLSEYRSTIEFFFNEKRIICPKFVMVGNTLVSEFYSIQDGDEINILNYYTLAQVLEFMDLEYDEYIMVNGELADLDTKVYENFTITYDMNYLRKDMNEKNSRPIETDRKESEKLNRASIDKNSTTSITVTINGEEVVLSNKLNYIFVDILDFYFFDLTVAKGSGLDMKINGKEAEFTDVIHDNDIIELRWKE